MISLIHVGTVSKIPIKIHWTFFLFLLVVFFYPIQYGLNAQLLTVGMFLSVFVCVVLHEFGHALAARRYGVQTVHIILSPIGGLAQLNKILVKPVEEFVVAISGPLVNVAIALIIYGYLILFSNYPIWDNLQWPPPAVFNLDSFLLNLLIINIGLVVFNLIPAFPLDGGRMFRALLSTKFEITKSTKYAAMIGAVFSIALAVYGLYSLDVILVFIAIFIFVSGKREYDMIRTLAILENHTVREIMEEMLPISVTDHIEYVKHRLMTGQEKFLVVVNETEEVVGILFSKDLIEALRDNKEQVDIEEIMNKNFTLIHPDSNLSMAYQKMEEEQFSLLPVFNTAFLGTVDIQGIERFLYGEEKGKKNEKEV